MILLLISMILIVLQLSSGTKSSRRFQNDERDFDVPEPILTEKNGSVKVNEVDADTLELLPGIGPAFAERIVTERKENGPFYYPEDLEAVSGIGLKTMTRIRNMMDMTLNESGN